MRYWFLPALYCFFGVLSCLTLSSVAPSLAQKQLISFVIGGGLLIGLSRIQFSLLLRLRWVLYIGNILLLLLPLFAFASTRNTHRWIELGPLTYQPSQTAALLSVLVIIISLTSSAEITIKVLTKILLLASVPIGLVFAAPDLGSAALVAVGVLSPLLFVRIKWYRLLPFAGAAVLVAVGAWLFLLEPYQKTRLLTFMEGKREENYNTHQALIAVGSGQLLGRGVGKGVQSHLRFLPERQTDFVFASYAEEFGFVGASVLIGSYAALLLFLWYIAAYVPTVAGKLFIHTTALVFLIQASINIHMNLGLLPITGVTLPFMSYGGSSVLALAATLGVVQQLVRTSDRKVGVYIH